jgi:chromosome segregation ATPase
LTNALEQERSGHAISRRLLDEMRQTNRALSEENRNLKDQSVAMARDAEQMKHELGSTRTIIRDYGDRLGEVNRRFAATQDECSRLESALAEARKESRALARKVERLTRAERENDELHDKIRGLQDSLDHYRRAAGGHGADAPIVLDAHRRESAARIGSSAEAHGPAQLAQIRSH